jgi:hypothetical protein
MAVFLLLLAAAPAAAQTVLRSIGVSTVGSEAVVTIEANGPLPSPTLGTVDGPPRIFLDFPGVRARTAGVARSVDARIQRVRVGLFSATPVVTRVVIDLLSHQPHRVELATGRVMVFIGSATAPAPVPALPPPAAAAPPPTPPPPTPPRPAAPPPTSSPMTSTAPPRTPPGSELRGPVTRPASTMGVPPTPSATANAPIPPVPDLPPPMSDAEASRTPPARSSSPNAASSGPRTPYRPPAPPPPSKDIEKYREMAGNILDRLKLQIPLLESMQWADNDMMSRMPAALEEFDRLRDELTEIKPPETMRAQHDMLLQGARLASTSARLRLEASQSSNDLLRRNAASAAAGATLILERVFSELGMGVVDR